MYIYIYINIYIYIYILCVILKNILMGIRHVLWIPIRPGLMEMSYGDALKKSEI